jgi:peptidoglycan/LPS O-acetylase OafA/YrhL
MKYDPGLDGVRALAISAVVIYHAWSLSVPGGWIGVDIFFVLSGFLITKIMVFDVEENGGVDFRRFYIRRSLRLLPAFTVLLLFVLGLTFFMPIAERFDNVRSVGISALYMMNWNRAFAVFPQGMLGHTWILAADEQYYLIWPALFIVIRQWRPKTILSILLVVGLSWRLYLVYTGAPSARTYNGFDTHADGLLAGCILAFFLNKSPHENLGRLANKFIIIPIAALIAWSLSVEYDSTLSLTIGFTLGAILGIWIIMAVMQPGALRFVLTSRPMVYTGRISYGWYLWHYPILFYGAARLPHGTWIMFIGSYLAAMASSRLIERPFLRLKARFEPDRKTGSLFGDKPARRDHDLAFEET